MEEELADKNREYVQIRDSTGNAVKEAELQKLRALEDIEIPHKKHINQLQMAIIIMVILIFCRNSKNFGICILRFDEKASCFELNSNNRCILCLLSY